MMVKTLIIDNAVRYIKKYYKSYLNIYVAKLK